MTSKHFAVVGDPIDHSLSPRIHSAAYEQLGLDWVYEKHQVAKGSLARFLQDHGQNLSGLSVTMPLKPEAAALATYRDKIVDVLDVANTLVRSGDTWSAFNTDVFGIQQSLQKAWIEGISQVAILGAGATAQSALYALHLQSAASSVAVYVRDPGNTAQIVELAAKLGSRIQVQSLAEYNSDQDLTISTVPAEALESFTSLEQSGWLLNVNYAKANLDFSGSFQGHRVVNGEVMLIWQAIAQLRLFLAGNQTIPLEDEASLFAKMLSAL